MEELVVVCGRVVEVVAPTVVDVDDLVVVGARCGGGTGRGDVEGGAVDTTAGGAVVAVVEVVEVVVVEVEVDVTDADVVVGLAVVDARAAAERLVVGSVPNRLASFRPRDPPGGPPSTSAPAHRAATASNPMQQYPARHVRCCLRERAIASSSTNRRPT